jgi:hypothetical protein
LVRRDAIAQAKLASRAILDWTVKTAKVAAPLVEWLAFAVRR